MRTTAESVFRCTRDTWAPADPTDLPALVAVPRAGSALWWPALGVLRITSRTAARFAAVDAIVKKIEETVLQKEASGSHAVYGSRPTLIAISDAPYDVPPLAAAWSRTSSMRHVSGRIQICWSIYSYQPRSRVNGGAWTWRRAEALDGAPSREGPLFVTEEMAEEAGAWAAERGLAVIPGMHAGLLVTPRHLEACRAARAEDVMPVTWVNR